MSTTASSPTASPTPAEPERGLFAEPPERAAHHARQRRRNRLVIVGAALLAVVVVIAVAATSQASTPASYRTATVADRPVNQVLTGVGTIEPVSQAAVAFPVAGTVETVDVHVGDAVTAGQALAALDTTALTRSLHVAQASAAKAALTLADALAGKSVPSQSGSQVRGAAYEAASTPGIVTVSLSTASQQSTSPELAIAQQAVLAAQRSVDVAMTTSRTALAAASRACGSARTPSPSPTTSTPPSTTSTSVPSTTTGTASVSCQSALQATLVAQQATADSQTALAKAAGKLTDLLGSIAAGSGSTRGSASMTRSSESSTPSGQSTSETASTPSASKLIAYQKAVDAADATVAVAEQSLAQATIVSPIAGNVAAVDLVVGDSVTAASTTATVVVVGSGGFEVTTLVQVSELPHVKVGQAATVAPDGSQRAIAGKVVAIGLKSQTSGSSTVYPVAIALDDAPTSLGNGATASVGITTNGAARALAVPTSAVSTIGTRHVVTVLSGSKSRTVSVGVGAIGATWTQVTSGLTAGQTVVLANLSSPLPGSATATTTDGTSGGSAGQRGFGGFAGRTAGGGGFVRPSRSTP